jgi:AcrR family transcriptional regulator
MVMAKTSESGDRAVRLGARDWTAAGLKALEEEGYPAVRADRLAAALKVSRGSFYWHFADVAAFEAALVAHWREMVLAALDPPMAEGETPLERFETIMRRVLGTTRRLEVQFRAWGAVSASVRTALDQVDANRLAHFARLLARPERSESETLAVARIAYWTYLGRLQTPAPDDAGREHVVEQLVRLANPRAPIARPASEDR